MDLRELYIARPKSLASVTPESRTEDWKVQFDIIYFSKLLFICFGVSVLQIFSTTFVSLGVHICFCGRAHKKTKRAYFDIIKKTHGCFNIIRNKRVK